MLHTHHVADRIDTTGLLEQFEQGQVMLNLVHTALDMIQPLTVTVTILSYDSNAHCNCRLY